MLSLHQALTLVPPDTWDAAICNVFACVCYQLTRCGAGLNEPRAIHKALLAQGAARETGAAAAASQRAVASSPRAAQASPRCDEEAVPSSSASSATWPQSATQQQAALLDCWEEEPAFRGVAAAALREAAALGPCLEPEEPSLLALARYDPAHAWQRVLAQAAEQAALEASDAERTKLVLQQREQQQQRRQTALLEQPHKSASDVLQPDDKANEPVQAVPAVAQPAEEEEALVAIPEGAAVPAVEQSLRDACRVARAALDLGRNRQANEWLANASLVQQSPLQRPQI